VEKRALENGNYSVGKKDAGKRKNQAGGKKNLKGMNSNETSQKIKKARSSNGEKTKTPVRKRRKTLQNTNAEEEGTVVTPGKNDHPRANTA